MLCSPPSSPPLSSPLPPSPLLFSNRTCPTRTVPGPSPPPSGFPPLSAPRSWRGERRSRTSKREFIVPSEGRGRRRGPFQPLVPHDAQSAKDELRHDLSSARSIAKRCVVDALTEGWSSWRCRGGGGCQPPGKEEALGTIHCQGRDAECRASMAMAVLDGWCCGWCLVLWGQPAQWQVFPTGTNSYIDFSMKTIFSSAWRRARARRRCRKISSEFFLLMVSPAHPYQFLTKGRAKNAYRRSKGNDLVPFALNRNVKFTLVS